MQQEYVGANGHDREESFSFQRHSHRCALQISFCRTDARSLAHTSKIPLPCLRVRAPSREDARQDVRAA
jgi:hypothetical protein